MPRDVEPEAAELDDILLYTVDDLIKDDLSVRVEAVREAEAMIADQAASFCAGSRAARWCRPLPRCRVIMTGCAPPSSTVRAACLPAVRRRSGLEQLARGLTNKFLHAPTQALNHAGDAERAELLALLHHIYQLPTSLSCAPARAGARSDPPLASGCVIPRGSAEQPPKASTPRKRGSVSLKTHQRLTNANGSRSFIKMTANHESS